MKVYARNEGAGGFSNEPFLNAKYGFGVLYEKHPGDPETLESSNKPKSHKNLMDMIRARNPCGIADFETTEVYALLREHNDSGLPEGIKLSEYHALYFPDKPSAIRFVKPLHPDLRYIKSSEGLEGLSNHKYHIHVGDRARYIFRIEGRTPVYIFPCNGKCDDDLNQVLDKLGHKDDEYREDESFIARDDDEVLRILEPYRAAKRYIFGLGEYNEQGLLLPDSIKKKVSDLEAHNRLGFEDDKRLGTLTINLDEQAAKEIEEATNRVIERMRKKGRRARRTDI